VVPWGDGAGYSYPSFQTSLNNPAISQAVTKTWVTVYFTQLPKFYFIFLFDQLAHLLGENLGNYS
jgi:hypothetical protein